MTRDKIYRANLRSAFPFSGGLQFESALHSQPRF